MGDEPARPTGRGPNPAPLASPVFVSAAIMALSLLGDSLLYVVLPLYAGAFGISLGWVGVLLSANRMTRVVLYGTVAAVSDAVGPRRLTLIAALFATGSTLAYALADGGIVLLLARICWGLAFAALNLTTLAYAVAQTGRQGRSVGRSRSIISLGPVLSLTIGSWLVTIVGPRDVFSILAAFTACALLLAFLLPHDRDGPPAERSSRAIIPRPKRIDMLGFIMGLGADGIFVLSLTLILIDVISTQSAVLTAGLMIAARRFMEVLTAPVSGMLGDRFGAGRMVFVCGTVVSIGLGMIAAGVPIAGAIAVVLAHGALLTVQPVLVAQRYPHSTMARLAVFATWRDIGAAAGPLVAGFLLEHVRLELIYAPLAVTTLAVVVWVTLFAAPEPERPHQP